ncbi:hypothetical protein ACSHWG_01110 [Leucobacter sp. Z1108]
MPEPIPTPFETAIALAAVAVICFTVALRRGWFRALAEWLGFRR